MTRHQAGPPPLSVNEPAYQYSLLGDEPQEAVVNVASVPQRSPFRYPGGKTWLIPRLRAWIASLSRRPTEFVEPFAGGGILSLTVAFERLAEHVTMVELDPDIAAVWKTILGGEAQWLAERIASFRLNQETLETTLAHEPKTLQDHAFQTILRNRVNRGGILAPGAGRIRSGENGKGIESRWYPQTLRKRILAIAQVAHRISFIQGDGLEVIQELTDRQDAIFFIDPPYTAAGKRAGSRLYTYSELDHEELFRLAGKLSGDFLMTYDNAEPIREMAEEYGFTTLAVPMKNTHHARLSELLIGRDLSWA